MAIEAIRIETGAHVVRFCEDDPDVITTMAGYVIGAIDAGDAALVIASADHREALTAFLHAAGINVAEACRAERLVIIDAAATLTRFYSDGHIAADRFRSVLGGTIRHVARHTGRPVRCYGEMVGLLWDVGAVTAAIELEDHWNDLSRELAFSLLCCYSNQPVGSEHSFDRWDVCMLHSGVVDTRSGAEQHFRPGRPGAAEMLGTYAVLTELSRLELSSEVYQACGMLAVQLGVNTAEALNRLRSCACDHGKTLDAVAADVVSRRLIRVPAPGTR